MRLYPDTRIYVLCPSNYNSGGPELCHQLCSQLIIFGINAYMFYFADNSFDLKKYPVDDFYKKYHLPYATTFEDTEHNILVAYEGPTEYLYMPKKSQRVLWWLSADNFLSCLSNFFRATILNTRLDIMPLPKIFSFHDQDKEMDHLTQSEYARQFLKVNGIPEYKIYMVEDYLNQAFLSRAAQVDLNLKENFVAFNPVKGFEVTRQLIEYAPDITWRPIQNMTPAQVQALLAKAKVYIDFGNHPGKDRIPREAAISGCVVITGKRGAAANDIDINIPAEFKFDEKSTTIDDIIKKIREVFDNFPANHAKQADYRARILDDKNRFANEVAEAFNIKTLPPSSVALTQGVSEESYLLATGLFNHKDFAPTFIVDDAEALTKSPDKLILREQNRNYLRVGKNFIEIITRDDAKFLYLEGRIKKFALLEPSDNELAELRNFYTPDANDILIFTR